MRANIITIDGNNAACGHFSMIEGSLHNGGFKIGFDEQQLLDLSALLSWWRHGKFEQEEAADESKAGEARNSWRKYEEAPEPKDVTNEQTGA